MAALRDWVGRRLGQGRRAGANADPVVALRRRRSWANAGIHGDDGQRRLSARYDRLWAKPPMSADWPENARVAVRFVINYEEGGENNILHGDAASEAFLSEIVGAAPGRASPHEDGDRSTNTARGPVFGDCTACSPSASVPVTVYAIATAMARNEEAIAAMNEAGWEIATHGLKWIDYRDTPPEVEARDIAEAVRIHTEVTGRPPARLLSGPHLGKHDKARHGGGRVSLTAPIPTRTTCPTGSTGRAGRN